jgi:hypothetical protein
MKTYRKKLRLLLGHHEAVTTAQQGWARISNGELEAAAENAGLTCSSRQIL